MTISRTRDAHHKAQSPMRGTISHAGRSRANGGGGLSSGLELGKYGIGSGTIENGTVRGVRSKSPPPPRTRRDERFGGGERDQNTSSKRKKNPRKILGGGATKGILLPSFEPWRGGGLFGTNPPLIEASKGASGSGVSMRGIGQ